MSLTLAPEEKPSTLMGRMCSLLPLNHKDDCFLFKGFFLDYLPMNVRTHMMREDISDPHKLTAKADKIWQSSSARSVNAVFAASPPLPDQDDFVNALLMSSASTCSQCFSSSCSVCSPSSHSVLCPNL